jgi:hypothetical protein
MELKAVPRSLRICALACLAVLGLAASEHRGVVKFGPVPVPGATVTATKDDKKVVAVTDESGAYMFPDLEDGVWKVQVEMLCFTTVAKDIGVAPGAPAAEWELKLQSMDEIKVKLTAAAPAPALAATTAPATAAPTTPAAEPATPSIAAAAAAANAKPPAKGKKGAAPTTPQAGFQRADVNASGDAPPPTGAAASGPPPDTSQASDAFVVNGSTSNGIERRAIGNGRKGPGSLFNGGLSFILDNDVLDARNYSLSGANTPRQAYNHFQVGATLGGPVYIPHVFRWNNANFFIAYQVQRNRTASNATGTMPSQAERTGDFSGIANKAGTPITLLDPASGQPIPNGIIPASEISPQAKYLLSFYPSPQFTAPGLFYNYQVPLIGHTATDAFQTRVNKNVNNKSQAGVSFGYQNSRTTTPSNVFAFPDQNDTVGFQATGYYNRTFTRQIFGRFQVQYGRQSVDAEPFFANNSTYGNVSKLAGIQGNDQSPLDWGPPGLGFQSGMSGLADGTQLLTRNQSLSFTGTLNYIRRPHNFQVGGDVKFQDFATLGQQNGRGQFGFNGLATGYDFADFLLGIPDTSSLAFGNADKYLKAGMYDAFINDDWRVNSSLTLNWGVRWEYGSPITEKYGRLVNLDIAPGFTSSAPVVASDPTGTLTHMRYPASLINPDKHAVQPRLSFAWRPIFGSSMVVRGGYGVYYNTAAYVNLASQMVQQSPLSKSLSVQNSAANPLTMANGFNASSLTTTNTFAIDPDFRVGYSQNWYLSVAQNVTASMLLTVQYSGVKGTRQPQAFLPNTYPEGALNPCPSCLPGYTYLTSNGNTTKHAGQLTLRRRFHGGLSTVFNYTYSKAIDDAAPGGATWITAQNWLDLSGERGLSSFDQRHLFTAAIQYSTGASVRGGALLSGWRGLIIKGWTIQSNINAGSGMPFSPVYSLPAQNTGVSGPLRPEYLGGSIYLDSGGRFLNPQAFGAPPSGQWGDAGRNSIIGPNQFTMNGSMQRSFRDNITVQFDAANVLNHPNYRSWNSTFVPNLANGGQFGLPNPPGAMRAITATFRWRF